MGRLTAAFLCRWQWEHNRAAFFTWLLLRLSVLAIMIRAAMQGYWENLFICLLVLFLFQLPSVLEKRLRITLPSGLQIIILVHIFACEILGEIACYYVRYPYWDTVMHTVWRFLCAAIGYPALAEWRFLLFTMIVTVNCPMWNVIRIANTPFRGYVAKPPPLLQCPSCPFRWPPGRG